MKTYMEQRDELVKAARDIAEKAQSEERELSVSEANEINAKGAEIAELNEKIRAAKSASDLLASLGEAKSDEQRTYEQVKFGTLGEYAADGLKDALGNIKARRRTQVDLAEYKSETPAVTEGLHTVTGTGAGFLQPQIDTNIVKLFRQGPTIASWLGSGTMESTAIACPCASASRSQRPGWRWRGSSGCPERRAATGVRVGMDGCGAGDAIDVGK